VTIARCFTGNFLHSCKRMCKHLDTVSKLKVHKICSSSQRTVHMSSGNPFGAGRYSINFCVSHFFASVRTAIMHQPIWAGDLFQPSKDAASHLVHIFLNLKVLDFVFFVGDVLTRLLLICKYIMLGNRGTLGIFWLTYQPHTSSADCAKELFIPSKLSASLQVDNEKNVWFWDSAFLWVTS